MERRVVHPGRRQREERVELIRARREEEAERVREAGRAGQATTRAAATIHSIQLLRAIAAILVVLFHGQESFAAYLTRPAFASESYLFAFGAVGVHIFFVISGFIMVVTSWSGNRFDAGRFFRRRLTRIYPIYWVSAGLYLLVHALLAKPYDLEAATVARAALLWPEDAPAIIGPAWTLSYEMFFYLCFGLAMMAGLERGLLVLGGGFLLAVGVGFVLPFDSPAWHLMTNALLLEFVAGAAIGWLYVRKRLPLRAGGLVTAAGVALFATGIAWGFDRLPSVLAWGAPSSLLVLGIVCLEYRSGASAFVRRAGSLGDSSYALYLIHVLIITCALEAAMLLPSGLAPEPAVAAFLIAPLAVVVAELLHRRIEQPMLRLLNRRR